MSKSLSIRCLATALIMSSLPRLQAVDSYSLRGQTTIGDTTYLSIQDTSTGRTRLLEVGDSQNRSIYVASWNPDKREGVIVANGQRITLAMQQASADGLSINTSAPTPQTAAFLHRPATQNTGAMEIPVIRPPSNTAPQVVGGRGNSAQSAIANRSSGSSNVVGGNNARSQSTQANPSTGGVVVGSSGKRATSAATTQNPTANLVLLDDDEAIEAKLLGQSDTLKPSDAPKRRRLKSDAQQGEE